MKADAAESVLRQITQTESAIPHMSELAEAFIKAAGGAAAMAEKLQIEFDAAPPGSLVRSQIFGMIGKVWKYASDTLGNAADPESLSDQDLDKEIQRVVKEIFGGDQAEAPQSPSPLAQAAALDAGQGADHHSAPQAEGPAECGPLPADAPAQGSDPGPPDGHLPVGPPEKAGKRKGKKAPGVPPAL